MRRPRSRAAGLPSVDAQALGRDRIRLQIAAREEIDHAGHARPGKLGNVIGAVKFVVEIVRRGNRDAAQEDKARGCPCARRTQPHAKGIDPPQPDKRGQHQRGGAGDHPRQIREYREQE
jgi:hypothetical protein